MPRVNVEQGLLRSKGAVCGDYTSPRGRVSGPPPPRAHPLPRRDSKRDCGRGWGETVGTGGAREGIGDGKGMVPGVEVVESGKSRTRGAGPWRQSRPRQGIRLHRKDLKRSWVGLPVHLTEVPSGNRNIGYTYRGGPQYSAYQGDDPGFSSQRRVGERSVLFWGRRKRVWSWGRTVGRDEEFDEGGVGRVLKLNVLRFSSGFSFLFCPLRVKRIVKPNQL